MKILELQNAPLSTLRQMAKDLNISGVNRLKKDDLIHDQQLKPNEGLSYAASWKL
jgi:hypothetical protein